MARLPRYALPGQPQHLIQRGNNRCAIFVSDDDYQFYLECLSDAAKKTGCDVHAYVLMTNHVHLLVTPQQNESIAKMLQSVGRRYVQHFNRAYQRSGTLWEGRYKATLIDSEAYLLTCYRYIELNPVRAGMVLQPGEYPWSSYRCHTEGVVNGLITDHSLYFALGMTPDARRIAYRQLLNGDLSMTELDSIREATNKAWVLGSDRFKEEISALADRRVKALPKGRPRKGNKIESDPKTCKT
jgi:putative transposase